MMKTEAGNLIRNKTYEVLMKINEKENQVGFYAIKDNDKFKDMVMIVDQPNQCVIMRLQGTFTAEDIQKVMKDVK